MLNSVFDKIGNTPLIKLQEFPENNLNIYAKLEYYNPSGSIKDRAAKYIIDTLLKESIITENTMLIESSSGNFGISLAYYSRKMGIAFCCVIDKHICPINEFLINKLCTKVIKITEEDGNGGCLLNRIKKVKEILNENKNCYWINQYSSNYNWEAYYNTLGNELGGELSKIDYIFIGVSSGGTITGLSRRIKELHPDCYVIAVDMEGSVVFGGPPGKRSIPGIGSSMIPDNLKNAIIDEIIIVNENDTVNGCLELLEDQLIFAGGSSGSVFIAARKYFSENPNIGPSKNVVLVLPDRGDRYLGCVY